MRWVYFLVVSVFSFCQTILGHTSTLVSIAGTNIPQAVQALVGRSYSSTGVDQAGICYATGSPENRGVAAQQVFDALHANPPQNIPSFQSLPRCHSEVALLRAIATAAGSNIADLNGCRIEIKNSNFYPCRTACGRSPFPGRPQECNPGIPCHTLLGSCHTQNGAFQNFFGFLCGSIRVTYPGGGINY